MGKIWSTPLNNNTQVLDFFLTFSGSFNPFKPKMAMKPQGDGAKCHPQEINKGAP